MPRSRAIAEKEAPGEVPEGRRPGPHPEPSPARRALIAIFALMLATAGIAFAVGALRTGTPPAADPSSSPSFAPSLTGDPQITAEIPLVEEGGDGGVGGVAVSAGSAWVGVQREGTSSVARIDLATNEVVAEIPVKDTPWRKRIAATDDAVWVASTGTLERIDPDTNIVVASVNVQGRSISAIVADSAAVWVVAITEPADEGGEWTGTLLRVDPATNEVVAEIPLGSQVAGYEDEVVLGAGSVWVLRWFEREDAEYGSDLIRIDPATNSITARIPVGGFHMVIGTDEVWVFSFYRPLWTDHLLAKRQRAAYGGTVGPGGSPVGLRMQPRNEKFFTLFSKAGSNVVESAALLMEFVAAPHGRWAVLANAGTTPSTPATTPLNSDLTGSIHAVRSTIANAVGSSDTNRAHDSRPSQSADKAPNA